MKNRSGSWWRPAVLLACALAWQDVGAVADQAAMPVAKGGAPGAAEARIKALLEQRLPDAKVESVHRSTIPGLFEVVMPTEIAYADERGDVLLLGHMIDTRTRMDLGVLRWNELHAVPFASLPLELAIKTVKGAGRRQMAVFADPDCPYCRQLENTLKDVDDVTVYTFLFPLEDLHPGATHKGHEIWCAPDRSLAWSKWVLERSAVSKAECAEDPIASLQALAKSLDVSGTPTQFFADGRRIAGALSRIDLEHALNGEPLSYQQP